MEDFQIQYNKVSELLKKAVDNYYHGNSCACQYPRFIQIVGINCTDFGDSFKAWETTLLISKVKIYFNIETLENGSDCSNEKWTCKKCKSEFNYGWSDFSISIEREVLLPIDIRTKVRGAEATKPIPLYLGLYGFSYPSTNEIYRVEFDDFEKYILDK